MASLSLRNKLLIGFGLIITLVIFLLLYMFYSLNLNIQNTEEIIEDRYVKVNSVNNIRYEINNISRSLLYINIRNLTEIDRDIDQISRSELIIAQELGYLQNNLVTPEGISIFASLNYNYQAYDDLAHRIIQAKSEGRNLEVNNLILSQEAVILRTNLDQSINDMRTVQEQLMGAALQRSQESFGLFKQLAVLFSIFFFVAAALISFWVMNSIIRTVRKISSVITSASSQQEDLPRIEIETKDEIREIAVAYNQMADSIEEHARREKKFNQFNQDQNWLKTNIAEIATLYQGVPDLESLAKSVISELAPMVGASYGSIFIREEEASKGYRKLAAYADDSREVVINGFMLGEGLAGQSAQDNRLIRLDEVPKDYLQISSSLGTGNPACIMILPIEHQGQVLAVLELASFKPFSQLEQTLLEQVTGNMGVTLNSVAQQMRVKALLEGTQVLNEELQAQSEELQGQSEEMQSQHEELKSINEQLEVQNRQSEQRSRELETIRLELEDKNRKLSQASQFKSEFLANMSHELRTPLNSMLILAELLASNSEGNLTLNQVEFAKTIHLSGKDLLNLINDILDLTKIESGKIDINLSETSLETLKASLERQFTPVALRKKLGFSVILDDSLPDIIFTDEHRLKQILVNFLSNAFKFTETGKVILKFGRAERKFSEEYPLLQQSSVVLEVSVSDNGIGIPKHKQDLVFEAFRQASGGTSRKYGGTGLGLSICRDTAKLLGGLIELESEEGRGSTFILYLPVDYTVMQLEDPPVYPKPAAIENLSEPLEVSLEKDEADNQLAGKTILLVDDDMRNVFALTTALEMRNLKVLFAENGREAINLLRSNSEIDLVVMDIMMPELDGYETIRMIRQMPEFQGLPIIALTAKAMKHDRKKCIEAGASDYLRKPVEIKQLMSLIKVWLYRRVI